MNTKGTLSYQASFFANVESIHPSADTIPPLLDAFRDMGFLPTTFTQITPGGARTRLRLSSPREEWFVDFDVNRINIVKNATQPWGTNLGSPSGFTNDVAGFVDRILKLHPVSGSRLALVTSELVDTGTAVTPLDAYAALARPLPFYSSKAPREWQLRSADRVTCDIAGEAELLNVITKIGRAQGKFETPAGVQEFDDLSVELDINTYQDNPSPRFDGQGLRAFFAIALEQREHLMAQLGERLAD